MNMQETTQSQAPSLLEQLVIETNGFPRDIVAAIARALDIAATVSTNPDVEQTVQAKSQVFDRTEEALPEIVRQLRS